VSLEQTRNNHIEVVPKKSDGRDSRWMWSPKKVEEELDRIYARKVSGRNEYDIYVKDYLERQGEQRTSKPRTMWIDAEVNTEIGGTLLKKILGEKTIEYPKPLGLLKRVIQISGEKDSIILDSFAGSGTTAHAVLALNKEDGGNRKFILVECEDYADSITAERVRRVIKGIPSAKDESLKKGFGGTFSYFELGKPIEMESILEGKDLPSYKELARYVFYSATGEEFNPKAINQKRRFIGESRNYEVFLFYEPELEKLKNIAFTLDMAEKLGPVKKDKRRLVFAPTKYLDQDFLDKYRIDFAQLPFEIYKLAD